MVQICLPNAAAAALWEEKQNVYTAAAAAAAAAGAPTAQKPSFIPPRSNPADPPGEFPRSAALAEREPSRPWWGIAAARLSLCRSPWQVRTYLRWLAPLPPLLPSHLSRCTFIFCWHADIRAIRQQGFPSWSVRPPSSQCYHGWIVATVAARKIFIFFFTILALPHFRYLNAGSGCISQACSKHKRFFFRL